MFKSFYELLVDVLEDKDFWLFASSMVSIGLILYVLFDNI